MMIEVIGEAATYELLAEECIELAHAVLKMARFSEARILLRRQKKKLRSQSLRSG